MLIKEVKNDYSFENKKRLAIFLCDENEQGQEVKIKDIENLYKLDDYKGIVLKGECFKKEEKISYELGFLCSTITENNGDCWAETKYDIYNDILKKCYDMDYFFLASLNYIFNKKQNKMYMKKEIGFCEYLWENIEYKE